MPNHLHGIIVLTGNAAAGASACPPGNGGAKAARPTLGDVVRTFKSISAVLLNRLLSRTCRPLWQRNYYKHIIRNERSLNASVTTF